ncbi:MAG: DUF1294 domain-containing protein [Eubacteriales bacterium]|nr:DUF1294 domain-containing protein [Eubacteriales bacterium]
MLLQILWTIYALINLITFILYGLDKRKARKGSWRIKERTLLTWTWCMGGVGAFLAMQLFRHKTKHKAFTISAPIASVLNIALMILGTGN